MITPDTSNVVSSMMPQHISSSCCSSTQQQQQQQRRIIFPNLHPAAAPIPTTPGVAAMSTVTPVPRNSGTALGGCKTMSSNNNYTLRSAAHQLVILSHKDNSSTSEQEDTLGMVPPPPPCFSTAATPMMKRSIHASVTGRGMQSTTPLEHRLEKSGSRRTIIMSRQLSDVPSLTSLSSTESMESASISAEEPASTTTASHRRVSVSFDPRVWVRVFERSAEERDLTWYQPEDLDAFKYEAMRCIQKYEHGKMPTTKCSFSHQALQPNSPEERRVIVESILIVDPHDLVLSLLTKSFKLLWPDASIDAVQTTAAALEMVANRPRNKPYDVMAVEERLSLFHHHRHAHGDQQGSGSLLLEQLRTRSPTSLLIGMSAHLDVDQGQLEAHADLVWGKPPPAMTDRLRHELEEKVRCKRKGTI